MKNYLALFSLLICLVSIACNLSGSGQIGGAQATNVPQVVSAVQSTPTAPLATTATSAAPPAVTPTHAPASQNDPTGTVSSELFFSPGATQTPAPTSTPTPTRTPTHTAVPQAASGATLPNELFFFTGGGVPWVCEDTYRELSASSRPHFLVDAIGPKMWEIAALCLFDFPANEWITIDVYGPDRNYLSSLVFRAIPEDYDYYDLVSQDGGFVGRGWDIDGKILMEIDIWDSTTIPMGEWYATAASDTKYVEGAFEVLIAEEDLPHVSIGPDVRYDPFYSYASYKNYSAGESVVISGIGFDSHQSITIGIYYGGNEPYLSYDSNLLVYSQAVTADARGNVSLKLTVEANDREGLYVVVLSTDDFDDGNSVFTDGSRIFRIRRPAQINCPGAAQTRLNVRYYAQVTFTDGTASSIREAPASSTIVGRVPEGTGMYIVGGPECHNQLVWWRVQTDNGHEGWVAEGRPGDYWLEPVD